MLLFLAIGLSSNKLGVLYYMVFLFILLTYLYTLKTQKSLMINFKFIRKVILVIFYAVIMVLMFISLNPRANPENKVGGSIDFEYLYEFTQMYNSTRVKTEGGRDIEGSGRYEAPVVAIDRLTDGGVINLFFGFGPGAIVKSGYLPYENPLLDKYNIGYGGRIGFVWIIMQIGIVGTVLFLLFHIYLFRRVFKTYRKQSISMSHGQVIAQLTVVGFSILYFIDYFTYSSLLIKDPTVTLVYFFSIYYVLVRNNMKTSKIFSNN